MSSMNFAFFCKKRETGKAFSQNDAENRWNFGFPP